MGLVESFRDLRVYQAAFDASLSIHKTSRTCPHDEQYGLTSQIRRSSKSICANIAEGFVKQKRSSAEFKRYLLIALGSCCETQVWIEYCVKLDYITNETYRAWHTSYEEIRKMLNALHAKS